MGRFDEALNLVEYVVHHEDLRRGSGPVPPRELLRPSSTRSGVVPGRS